MIYAFLIMHMNAIWVVMIMMGWGMARHRLVWYLGQTKLIDDTLREAVFGAWFLGEWS